MPPLKYKVSEKDEVPTFLTLGALSANVAALENGETLDYVKEPIRREVGRVLRAMINGQMIVFSPEDLELPF